ncbi:MAG: flagellar export chaperone FliS [Burkholderiales bacterium 66-5]|uniref:flagellar export chaperone FliS n=1 Tax=Comamonas badia TaxID=265291 RepID=UPI0003F748F2|nr:flagellar export chaperone FliS [Comamonas badia]OJU92665.1 MAG: flagellar export chaperone FliS [Burkholderiales bacterium 66-5]
MYTPASSRAANAYRQVGVQSGVTNATPHTLVQMLFDGLMQRLQAARGDLQRSDVQAKGVHLGQAVQILGEGLKASLNAEQGGELAQNLGVLYDYCIRQLTMANLHNDIEPVEEVIALIAPVARGWKEIGASGQAAEG